MGATGSARQPTRAPTNAADGATSPRWISSAAARGSARTQRERTASRRARGPLGDDVGDTAVRGFRFRQPAGAHAATRADVGPGRLFPLRGVGRSASPPTAAPCASIKKRLTLPAATTTDLTIGSVILADGIQIRTAPYKPAEQASHPYAIGLTEIVPSADANFADTENLSVVFQVINARPADSGKPNVDIAFEVVRVVNSQEQAVAALTPQNYSEKNLPAEFDLRAGHPLFATVSAPLATLKRGIVSPQDSRQRSHRRSHRHGRCRFHRHGHRGVAAARGAAARPAVPAGVDPRRRRAPRHPRVAPSRFAVAGAAARVRPGRGRAASSN